MPCDDCFQLGNRSRFVASFHNLNFLDRYYFTGIGSLHNFVCVPEKGRIRLISEASVLRLAVGRGGYPHAGALGRSIAGLPVAHRCTAEGTYIWSRCAAPQSICPSHDDAPRAQLHAIAKIQTGALGTSAHGFGAAGHPWS